MGIVSYSQGAYSAMMRTLLPPGRAFAEIPVVRKVLDAASEELKRVGDALALLVDESDPRKASVTLEDYEKDYALESTGTTQERQDRIVAKKTTRGSFRAPDVESALYPYLGVVVVNVFSSLSAAVAANPRLMYLFHVYRDPALPGPSDIDKGQEVLDSITYSHNKGVVIQSLSFKCDDPYSLCDRDPLGI